MSEFNPSDPKYKKVEDLPEEDRSNFANVEGGFVRGEATSSFEGATEKAKLTDEQKGLLQKIFGKDTSPIDILQGEALSEDERFESNRADEQQKIYTLEKELENQRKQLEKEREFEEWKTKNPEFAQKLELFQNLLETGPSFRGEVIPVLRKFAGIANVERSDDAYRLYHESRKLAYQRIKPDVRVRNGARETAQQLYDIGVFDMPSDWRSIEDDKEFAQMFGYEGIDLYYLYRLHNRGFIHNFSLVGAILPDYLRGMPLAEIEDEVSALLRTSRDDLNLLRYFPTEQLKGSPVSQGRIDEFQSHYKEASAMSKEEYAAHIQAMKVKEIEEKVARQRKEEEMLAESARIKKEREELKRRREELQKKLLGGN